MPPDKKPKPEKPLWTPGADRVDRANLSRFMRFVRAETGKADLNSYAPLYRFSIDQPAAFWTLLWDFVGIRASGERTPVIVQDEGMASAHWFPGVSLNFAQNLLRFDDERVAIRCHGAGDEQSITYAQLQRRVAALTAAMKTQGIAAGDRVASLLPNMPEAIVAMLASASLGATWFALPADRSTEQALALLASVQPALILIDDASQLDLETVPEAVVMVTVSAATPAPARVRRLEDFVAPHADAVLECTPVAFEHPLYLTCAAMADGREELVVHGTGGTLIQHLKELVLHADLKREDKIFFHAGNDSMAWYWLASSLAIGSTLVLHAGDELPPGGSELWDLVDEYAISVLGVHSQWLDAAARAGVQPRETHRLLSLKTILAAGASLAADSYDFVYRDIKERLLLLPISTAGDTLACFGLGAPLLPVWRGEIACRGLGMQVEVLNAASEAVIGEIGELACSAAFPSMPLGFWADADGSRYQVAYFSRHDRRWCRGEHALLTVSESLRPGR